jgi:hypothetical protein
VNRNLPEKHEYHVVPNSRFAAGGGHFAFMLCGPAMANAMPQFCRDESSFDRAAFHRQFNKDVLAFFRAGFGDR